MSTLTVKNIQGVSPTNQITVPAGHRIIAPAGGVLVPGQVVQVKQTAKTDTWSASPGVGVFSEVTGFSVSITPYSSTSKVMVMVNAYLGHNNYQIKGLVKRNGTTIAVGDAAGTRPRVSFNLNSYAGSATNDSYHLLPTAFNYLDSPATTSSCVYTVELSAYGGSWVGFNRSYTWQENANDYDGLPVSTITVMEIAH